jgi:hypothetical protein
MRWLPTITPAAVAVAAIFGVASGATPAEGTAATKQRCVALGAANIQLADRAEVDEVRVVVHPGAAERAEARVDVSAGAFGRVVRVFGDQSKSLRFTTPLAGRLFSLQLSTLAHTPAPCVARIELRRGGQLVASHYAR